MRRGRGSGRVVVVTAGVAPASVSAAVIASGAGWPEISVTAEATETLSASFGPTAGTPSAAALAAA